MDGMFKRFHIADSVVEAMIVPTQQLRSGTVNLDHPLDPMDESLWEHAKVWQVKIPEIMKNREFLLRVHYRGNMARIYAGEKPIMDDFYHGQPMDAALWRVASDQRDRIEIRILPFSLETSVDMPEEICSEFPSQLSSGQVMKVEGFERRQWVLEVIH